MLLPNPFYEIIDNSRDYHPYRVVNHSFCALMQLWHWASWGFDHDLFTLLGRRYHLFRSRWDHTLCNGQLQAEIEPSCHLLPRYSCEAICTQGYDLHLEAPQVSSWVLGKYPGLKTSQIGDQARAWIVQGIDHHSALPICLSQTTGGSCWRGEITVLDCWK